MSSVDPRELLKDCKTAQEAMETLAANGISASIEEVERLFPEGGIEGLVTKMSDDELEAVAGGGCLECEGDGSDYGDTREGYDSSMVDEAFASGEDMGF